MTRTSYNAAIFGIPLSFESDSVAVLHHARALVASYRGIAIQPQVDALRVRITVTEGSGATPVAPQLIDAGDGRLLMHSADVAGAVEPLRRESVAWVGRAVVEDQSLFRTYVLEALTLALIACFDRHPLHAAAIESHGQALLLAGASGTGKSTLAWLAHRAGYHVLTDDRTWVQLSPALKIWGGPAVVRLGEKDAKDTLALRAPRAATSPHADRAQVCILNRGRQAALEPLSTAAVCAHLNEQLAPGFDRFPSRHSAVTDAIADRGGWKLTLTSNPEDAFPLLLTLLERSA